MKVKDSLRGLMMMTSDALNKYSRTHISTKFLEQDIGSILRKWRISSLRLYLFLKQSFKFIDIHRIDCVILWYGSKRLLFWFYNYWSKLASAILVMYGIHWYGFFVSNSYSNKYVGSFMIFCDILDKFANIYHSMTNIHWPGIINCWNNKALIKPKVVDGAIG